MKNNYNKVIYIFITVIIISLIMYVLYYKKCEIISAISGNVFAGLITGFTIFIITNIKNSILYKYDQKINVLTNIIEDSRNCEIEMYKFNSQNEIPIIGLINLYSDLSNCFEDIYQYNEMFFTNNKIDYKVTNNECLLKLNELCDEMYHVNLSKNKYLKYSKDLSKKLSNIFKLRRTIITELNELKKERENLYKSIF